MLSRILALPPADREPSRFAARGQAQKHLAFCSPPQRADVLRTGTVRGPEQYREAPSALGRMSSGTFGKCFVPILGHLLGELGGELLQLFQVLALFSDTDPCLLGEE